MKVLTFISIYFLYLVCLSKTIVGEYYDHFGNRLKINSDSTFIHKWNFDLASSWTKGKWNVKHDTIYFTTIPIFDTLRLSEKKDSLILSLTEIPTLRTYPNAILPQLLSSGGQNRREIDMKLYFKSDKLYRIDSLGMLITQKVTGFSSQEKYNTWFIKKQKQIK